MPHKLIRSTKIINNTNLKSRLLLSTLITCFIPVLMKLFKDRSKYLELASLQSQMEENINSDIEKFDKSLKQSGYKIVNEYIDVKRKNLTTKVPFKEDATKSINKSRTKVKKPIIKQIHNNSYKPGLPTKNVLVFARWRSGSTFAGSLFNFNPDVYYVFEPLFSRVARWGISYNQTVAKSEIVLPVFHNILEDFYLDCKVPVMAMGRFARYSEKIRAKFNKLEHKNLTINKSNGIEKFNNLAVWDQIPDSVKERLNEDCLNHGIKATKTIRLKSLNHLPDSLKKSNLGQNLNLLKVIYLIRDPRAIAKSRITRSDKGKWDVINQHPEDFDKLDHICETYERFWRERNSAILPDKTGNFIKTWDNQVLVIRYEDIAYQPLAMAEKIYKFIGIDKSSLPEVLLTKISKESRKSIEITKGWSKSLNWSAIDKIQNSLSCRLVFEKFGYEIVKNKEDYEKFRYDTETSWIKNPGCIDCDW